MPRSHATSERYCRCSVYIMLDGKDRNHETTRNHTNKNHEIRDTASCYCFFVLFRVFSWLALFSLWTN